MSYSNPRKFPNYFLGLLDNKTGLIVVRFAGLAVMA